MKIPQLLNYEYDAIYDILTVEGCKFSGDFFRQLVKDIPLGKLFTMVSRRNGVIEVKTVRWED